MSDPTTNVRLIGRYHVLDELGRGGMAVVYKGFDPVIGRTVALKTIAFGTADAEMRDLRARLYREACAAGTLSHPNIVTIYDVIEEEGVTAIAMELIGGDTLADVIEQRAPMALDAALEIFDQVCNALDYAGARGIVHRDIKPSNIMLTPDGRVKVADFGVARLGASHMTQTGTVLGSPRYMSPEQVRGQSLDVRSDLFSATVILYEMLTKERPFAGDDIATTMYQIVHQSAPPPSDFNAALSSAVCTVFERALAKEPDERYGLGAELVAEFRRAATFNPLPPIDIPLDLEPQRRRGLSPVLLVSAGILVLGALLILVLVLVRPTGPPDQQAQAANVSGSGGSPSEPPPAAAVSPQVAPGETVIPTEEPGSTGAAVGSVSTIPPPEPSGGEKSAPPLRREPARPAATPAPEPPAPSRPVPAAALLTFTYGGEPFPMTIFADRQQVGRISGSGTQLSIDPGQVRIRAVNEAFFLNHDFGVIPLESGGRRTLEAPTLVSAFIGVRGDVFDGLRILLDGRPVPGPYPAQLPQLADGTHRIVFRWSDGPLSGQEISSEISLSSGQHFLVRAEPERDQVAVQKLR